MSLKSRFALVAWMVAGVIGLSYAAPGPKKSDHAHDHHEEEEKAAPAHGKEEEESGHKHEEDGHKHGEEDEHKEGENHAHGEREADEHEHGEEEEASSSVGPDKGILAVSPKDGFQLSPEAIKTFGLKTQKVVSAQGLALPRSAIVYSGESVGVFRLRQGFYKRVSATIGKSTGEQIAIASSGITAGDEVVIQGAPFLRIAEIDASGGIGHGHSH